MTKYSNHSSFKGILQLAAIGFGLIALGVIIGFVGVALGGSLGTSMLIIGIIIAAIGGFLAGGTF